MSETIEAGESAEKARPWTVKGIGPEERNAATAAAEREGMTIGVCCGLAVGEPTTIPPLDRVHPDYITQDYLNRQYDRSA